jgi:hypothetical protein
MFTDIYAGWPGSVHDSRVLTNSPLSVKTRQNHHLLFPGDAHLIGDSGYPLLRYLIICFNKELEDFTTYLI